MIQYNDNARDYLARKRNARAYRNRESVPAPKKDRKATKVDIFLYCLIVLIIGFMLYQLPGAIDTMIDHQYRYGG